MKYEKLTECELLVMKCLWDSDESLTLPGVIEAVNTKFKKDWKPQTVSTFLGRLVKKKFLSSQRVGRTFYYHVLIPEKEYRYEEADQFVEFWCNGSAGQFLAALNGKRKLRDDEIRDIKKLLDGMAEK